MPDLIPFVATIRAVVFSKDEVEALLAIDQIETAAREMIDEEDGDRLVVTQVTSMTTDIEPSEIIITLIKARNALIRTRIKDCFDEAKQLDQIIWGLRCRTFNDSMSRRYDYSGFIAAAEAVLVRGEDPVDI